MASFRSEQLSIKWLKNKIIKANRNDPDFLVWAKHDPECKTLIFFIYLFDELAETETIGETFRKIDDANFFIACTQAINEVTDMSAKNFERAINIAIQTLSNLLKPGQVLLFEQLCRTVAKLIMMNYKTVPFEISANKNLDQNYDNRVNGAIQQCKLVEECHSLLRKILPKHMNQLAVLLNNLLIPLEI